MKTHKFILLNLFIFILSLIACTATTGTAYRSILLVDKPGRTTALQAGATLGLRPGYMAIFAGEPGLVLVFREGATQGQRPGYSALFGKEPGQVQVTRSLGTISLHPGYTALFKDDSSKTLAAVQP